MVRYLDNSSTTRPYDAVTDKMAELMKNQYGNPSSLHRLGIAAEKTIKTAREQVAAALRSAPAEIYFTSGGTESDNLAITGVCNAARGRHIISTPIGIPLS